MKKSIKLLCVSLFGALLFSCGNPAADDGKKYDGTKSPETNTEQPENPENDVNNDQNSGKNPFAGNSYIHNTTYEKYEFSKDGILTQYYGDKDKNTSEFNYTAEAEYEYSYDEKTKELTLKWSKTFLKKAGKLVSIQEWLDSVAYDLEEYELWKNFYNTKYIWKAELDEQENLLLQTKYYKEKPSFEDLEDKKLIFYNSNEQGYTFNQETSLTKEGYLHLGEKRYEIKTLTQDTIVAINSSNSEETITLSYILNEPKDGILSITLTTTDTPSETYTLVTEGPSTYTKVSE